MIESLKFLNRISKIKGLEPENYYAINLTHYGDVHLQGYINASLVKRLEKIMHKIIHNNDDNIEYKEFKKGRLTIVLT